MEKLLCGGKKKWDEEAMDIGMNIWLRVYGVPPHAWNAEFFMALAGSLGKFICLDDITASGTRFDVARGAF